MTFQGNGSNMNKIFIQQSNGYPVQSHQQLHPWVFAYTNLQAAYYGIPGAPAAIQPQPNIYAQHNFAAQYHPNLQYNPGLQGQSLRHVEASQQTVASLQPHASTHYNPWRQPDGYLHPAAHLQYSQVGPYSQPNLATYGQPNTWPYTVAPTFGYNFSYGGPQVPPNTSTQCTAKTKRKSRKQPSKAVRANNPAAAISNGATSAGVAEFNSQTTPTVSGFSNTTESALIIDDNEVEGTNTPLIEKPAPRSKKSQSDMSWLCGRDYRRNLAVLASNTSQPHTVSPAQMIIKQSGTETTKKRKRDKSDDAAHDAAANLAYQEIQQAEEEAAVRCGTPLGDEGTDFWSFFEEAQQQEEALLDAKMDNLDDLFQPMDESNDWLAYHEQYLQPTFCEEYTESPPELDDGNGGQKTRSNTNSVTPAETEL